MTFWKLYLLEAGNLYENSSFAFKIKTSFQSSLVQRQAGDVVSVYHSSPPLCPSPPPAPPKKRGGWVGRKMPFPCIGTLWAFKQLFLFPPLKILDPEVLMAEVESIRGDVLGALVFSEILFSLFFSSQFSHLFSFLKLRSLPKYFSGWVS